MIGSLQALEALKFLTGAQPPLVDAFLNVDLATLRDHARVGEPQARLPGLRGRVTAERRCGELRRDVAAVRERDPAAEGVSTFEILTGWPGLHALLAYRVAHALDAADVPFLPRALVVPLARADRDRDPPARRGSATGCSSTTAWAS